MAAPLSPVYMCCKRLINVSCALAPNGLLRYWQNVTPMDTVKDVFIMHGRMDTVAIQRDGLYLIVAQITFSVRYVCPDLIIIICSVVV